MNFGIVGVNYRVTSIELREQLSFNGQQIKDFITAAKARFNLIDALVLATCNRTEIYFNVNGSSPEEVGPKIWEFLLAKRGLNSDQAPCYFYVDLKAIEHLLKVATSLDSLVIGEAQVLGQVKDAFRQTSHIYQPSAAFARTFDFATRAARKVRSKTGIAKKSTSVGHVAVDLISGIFDDVVKKNVLVIGAGEISGLVLTHLQDRGVAKISIVNRTLTKTLRLAEKFAALALPFSSLEAGLHDADIVISSVDSPAQLISVEKLRSIMRARKYRSLFLLDLGVPRNITPEAATIDNLYLFNIDDLKEVANKNQQLRSLEAKLAIKIVKEELAAYQTWLDSFRKRSSISEFRAQFEEVYFSELKKAVLHLDIPPLERQKLAKITHRSSQKLLHQLTVYIKKNLDNHDEMLTMLYYMFQLDNKITDSPAADSKAVKKSTKVIKLMPND